MKTKTGIVLLLLIAFSAFAQPRAAESADRPAPRRGFPFGNFIVSPEVASDGRVTLRLRAPEAEAVQVDGFDRLKMSKDDEGVWTGVAEPLEPGVYEYRFTVDGVHVNDPSNNRVKTSFGRVGNSLVFVPGGLETPTARIARGAVTRHFYHSEIAGDDRDYYVYTPPGYDAHRPEPYPILVLMHGLGDDASSWVEMGAANVILDNLIAQGKAEPLVMVNTLGYGFPGGPRSAMRDGMLRNVANQVTNEVLPLVEDRYHVAADRTKRAIAGLSMGGAEAAFTGLNNLETFAWIGSFSGAYVMWPMDAQEGGGGPGRRLSDESIARVFPSLDVSANERIELLWITCGDADRLVGVNRSFHEWLDARDIRHTYTETPNVGHVWPFWRDNLAELAQKLFQ